VGSALAPGYRVIAHLARGNRLDVYDAWSVERDSRCILKTLRPDRADEAPARRALLLEGRLLRRLTHPHLVRAYDGTVTADGRPVVVLETLAGETLSHLLHPTGRSRRRLAPADAAELGRQLCSVVGYLHRCGYLHRDLKPANIVVESGRITLLDLSLVRPPGRARAGAGTLDYMAPEQVRGGELTTAVDVWGIGAVLHTALAGRRPFDHLLGDEEGTDPDDATDDTATVYPQVATRAPSLGRSRRVPRAIAELVDACLDPVPARRPSVEVLSSGLTAWLPAQAIPEPTP
jgi:serine/threonine protein kinase